MKEVADVLKEYKVSQDRKTNSDKVGKKSKPDLIKTLLFLHGTTAEDSPEMNEELNKKLKNILVTKVVNRIVNIQPEACKACRKSYYFDITERPSLRCLTCERGACQECFVKDEEILGKLIMNNAGLYFLCSPCSEPVTKEVREDKLPKGRKTKTTPATGLEEEITPSQGMDAENTFDDITQATQEVVEVRSDNKDDEDEEGFIIPKSQKKKNEKLRKKKEDEAKKKEVGDKTKAKCRFYMKNRCTHGVTGDKCPFSHPKRCPKWMKEGKEGCKKCDLFHPALCYGSLNDKKCEKSSCTFIHLPGTVRTPKPTEAGERMKPGQKDGKPRQNQLDCIICPMVFKYENQLTHHMNTTHSHKCKMCKQEFSHLEDLASHNSMNHRRIMSAGESVQVCPPDGGSNQAFLMTKPQEMGQQELMQSVTTMMKEVMKESQQQMMHLFSQLMQKQQQPPVMPMGWRMPGQH